MTGPPDSDLIFETQARWLRKPGKERWEMEELPEDKRAFVLRWAEKQELFAEQKPSYTQYNTALILGATTLAMQKRLDYPKEFLFDIAGPEATTASAAVLLDTVARWLYAEKSAMSMIRKK